MRTFVVFCLFATALPLIPAQAPSIPVSDLILARQTVDPTLLGDLITKLGDPDFREREKAGATLIALGDRALPQLKLALKGLTDYEVARRLGVIVRDFEEQRLIRARLVTLKVKDILPADAIRRICIQAGYKFNVESLTSDDVVKNRYAFNMENVPFWQAIDAVCNAAGLECYIQDELGILQFSYTDTHNPFISYSGPYRFVAQNINSAKSLNLARLSRKEAQAVSPENIYLSLMVMAEPKTQILNVKNSYVLKAIDDLGNEVKHDPNATNTSNYYGGGYGYRSYGQSMNLNIVRPSKDSKYLKEITGRAQIVVLSEVRPEITIPDLMKVKNKKYMGRSSEIELNQTEDNNGTVQIVMTVRQRNPGDPNDYTWANTIFQRFELTDAAGVKYQQNGWSNHNYTQTAISMTLNFTVPPNVKVGPPANLTMVEWVTITQDVDFTLKDIMLP